MGVSKHPLSWGLVQFFTFHYTWWCMLVNCVCCWFAEMHLYSVAMMFQLCKTCTSGYSKWLLPVAFYHVRSVQYCVQQLYTVQCTHIWTDLTVLWIEFCLTGPISLCVDSFVYCVWLYIVCVRRFVTQCRSVVCNLSVTLVHPTQAVVIFGIFYGVWYLGHPLAFTENFTEIVPAEPLRWGGGVKHEK